jgi:capsular polysaccharide export protein
VPGQVEDDASVRTGGFGLSNLDLLRRVREYEPDAFIVFKQHPDVVAGNRIGAVSPADALGCADLLAQDADILNCISVADEVHTLTSLTGFEALLRGKAVTVYGVPFYAGWGLTRDLFPEGAAGRRERTLSLDELVAGALILYPMYIDPVSGLPVSAIDFPARLEAARQALTSTGLGPGRWTPVRRFVRAAAETLHLRKRRSY